MKKVLVFLMTIIMILSICSCGDESENNAVKTNTEKKNNEPLSDESLSLLGLGAKLPKPDSTDYEVYEYDDCVSVDIDNVTAEDFVKYVAECEKRGFTVDAKTTSDSYKAFNDIGDILDIDFYEDYMSISLEKTKVDGQVNWPTTGLATLVPIPESTVGTIEYESSDDFEVYIGNTTHDAFAAYVDSCIGKGFDVDYYKDLDYFSAENKDRISLRVEYIGFEMMYISIEMSWEEEEEPEETQEVITTTTTTTQAPAEEPSLDGLRPEFKEAMDSYEEYMNEYVAFMKKYNDNPNDFTLLADYAKHLTKYSEMTAAFEKWEGDMNDAETAYYIDVQSRVSQKLLEVAA